MTPMLADAARWPALSRLLDEALALPPEERPGWLAALAGIDAEHRDTLRALLATQAGIETGDFLAGLPALEPTAPGDDELKPGAVVGPYRLVEPLGEGGMGIVWVAERADETARRRIALKLPRAVWGGAFAERLAREREILAALEHEHIARLYDAGVDARGRPYLAMELVEGQPIDAYCRTRALGVRERVELLLQAMEAVSHAHARLVVHRDLKPANILVRRDGSVRLLDFGVAKLLEGDRTRATALTELSGRALTLDYASPEQIAGEPLGTATDVYSLAVVAYELLSGRKPYSLKRGTAAELEEAIASAEVAPASTAAHDPALRKQLRGDLDAILNQALKKRPEERYATMDAFAQDLQRWRAGAPVRARPDGLGYRTRKFVGRYRLQVAAGGAVAAALVVGAGVALWQAREARLQAERAQTEAATAKAVQGFLERVFRANSGNQSDPKQAGQTTARELLDRGAERIETDLAAAPMARLQLLGVLASMYEDMVAEDKQLELQRKRLALARELTGPDSDETLLAMADVAHALTSTEQLDEADAVLKDAAARLDRRGDTTSRVRLRVLMGLASLHERLDPPQAVVDCDQALAIARRGPPTEELVILLYLKGTSAIKLLQASTARDALTEALQLVRARPELGASELAAIHGDLGRAQRMLGDYAHARASFIAALEVTRQQSSAPVEIHNAERLYAGFLHETGRYAESLDVIRPAVEWLQQEGASGLGASVPMMMVTQARALAGYGRAAEALSALAEAEAIGERMGIEAPPFKVAIDSGKAAALIALGRLAQARTALDRAQAIAGARPVPALAAVLDPLERRWLVASGRAADALAQWRASSAGPSADPARAIEALTESAWLTLEAGDAAVSEHEAARALAAIGAGGQADYQRHLEARATLVLGRALLRQQRAAEALPVLDKALALHRAVYDPDRSPAVADAWLALAQARRTLGDPRAAEADKEALRIRSATQAHI